MIYLTQSCLHSFPPPLLSPKFFYMPLFKLVTKTKLFLDRKKYRGDSYPPYHLSVYAYILCNTDKYSVTSRIFPQRSKFLFCVSERRRIKSEFYNWSSISTKFIRSFGPNKERFFSSDFWLKAKGRGNTSKIKGCVQVITRMQTNETNTVTILERSYTSCSNDLDSKWQISAFRGSVQYNLVQLDSY